MPRDTFLGLCEKGLLAPAIPCKKYTDSEKNKSYGLQALEVLRKKLILQIRPLPYGIASKHQQKMNKVRWVLL
jgi:hypothetical protein